MRQIWRACYGIYAWSLLVITVVMTTTAILVVPGLARRRAIARGSARNLFRLTGIGLQVSGDTLEHNEPVVVVSNHASYLDGIILTAALPAQFSFLVKREMRAFPVAGLLLRRLGTQFVERFDFRRGAADARRIIRIAGEGQALAAFPEGTFRQEPGLGQFYSGAFSAAVRNHRAIVPVTLLGSRHILPADKLLPRRGSIQLVVHPAIPINPATPDREEITRVRELARTRILSALDEPDLDFRLSAAPRATAR
ncbi:MAG: 1-acyl-sn-glycerol-3-phosphate acyltransferase [Gammaproteobacteria bacterium]|nr:1-acyl-sn-glycerol-3-phosphate acyltransferase [Gammaproteobacteria bacterium]NNF61630.1 1-acyl-sn-glycerol-3-phosphate acyltransferase [Gammaproteobacteria bacterium]NNM20564.1 1-acyl-sn-glycerol-3-phosphate acyltransferase [Gammaproteobacteria bacterium]